METFTGSEATDSEKENKVKHLGGCDGEKETKIKHSEKDS